MIRAAGGFVGRSAHQVLVAALALCVLAAVLALGLAWRLSAGPLDIAWAARRIEAAANTPGQPTRLSIGEAALRWGGFSAGAGRGLELQLRQVLLTDLQGTPVAAAGALDLSVSMARLLLGQVVPGAVWVEGLNLRLLHEPGGGVVLDLGGLSLGDQADEPGAPGPTVQETLAELARPPRPEGSRRVRPDLKHLELLEYVHLGPSVLHLVDPALRSGARLELLAMDLRRRPAGGVRGTADGTLMLGGARSTVALRAELAEGGGTVLQLAFTPVNATAAQAAEPALATQDGLDAAVQGVASLELDRALHPVHATVRLEAGAGQMRLADGTVGFDSIAIEAASTWQRPDWTVPQHLDLVRAKAVVHAPGGTWPTTLTASGQVDIAPDRLTGSGQGTLDHLAFADIGALWPKRLGGHVRPWLVPNITGGTARDASIKFGFTAARDLSDAALTSIDASVVGEDVTIWWLRPVPPVEQAQALLTMKTPAVLDIAVPSARQGAAALRNGLIHFTGMDEKDQFMVLTADVADSVPDLVNLLKHPNLQLLDRRPIPMRNPTGAVTGRLQVNMPMKDQIAFEDVHIQTSVKLTDLRLGGLVAGRDLDRAEVTMDVSSEQLKANGRGTIAGIPSDITVDMDFRNGGPAQPVQRAQATGTATPAQLAAAGFDTGGLMSGGAGQFTAQYQQRRDGSGELKLAMDLRNAALGLAGWTKPPGPLADASARVLLRGDRVTGIDQIRAQGPGMAVQGRAEMVGALPLLLVLDRVVLGATQASGRVQLPGAPREPIRARLDGPMLDLSAELSRPPPGPNEPPGTPWVADIHFDRVLLSSDPAKAVGLAGVSAHAENDGRRLSALTAASTGPEQAKVTIRRDGKGRALSLRAADGGALLRTADLLDQVQGGKLELDGSYDDTKPASPLTATAKLTDFHVTNAPALGKLLQAVTIYGMVDAMRGPGLAFSELEMPFRWDGGVLQLTDVRAFSSSLGLTARGRVDTGAKTIDVEGTVVPAYVFNSLLGRIPLLGRLFSAEHGGGLVAVNYSLRGPLANPSVIVNPLSALTPGFLRGLFHIFG